jgi:hypothetical protein
MTPTAAAWVRDHAWPPPDRRRSNLPTRPGTCSCTWGVCHNCAHGMHNNCITGDGIPAPDRYVTAVLGWDGWRVARVILLPRQRPCRLLCPCTHPSHPRREAPRKPEQLGLFEAVTA